MNESTMYLDMIHKLRKMYEKRNIAISSNFINLYLHVKEEMVISKIIKTIGVLWNLVSIL